MTRAQRPLTIAHATGESGFSSGEVQVFLPAPAREGILAEQMAEAHEVLYREIPEEVDGS